MKLASEPVDVLRVFPERGLGATPAGPTKRRRLPSRWAALFALCLGGCGYQPAYSSGARYVVVGGELRSSLFEVGQALLGGVRSELSAAAAESTSGFPRVEVDVVRVDERSIGVRNTAADVPLARGTEIVVVGRARVVDGPGLPASFDTGDMSRAAQFASGSTPGADADARSRAARDAARSLGKALGRAVLGLPEPAEG